MTVIEEGYFWQVLGAHKYMGTHEQKKVALSKSNVLLGQGQIGLKLNFGFVVLFERWFTMKPLINICLGYRQNNHYEHLWDIEEGGIRHKIDYFTIFQEILNSQVHLNRITGSRVPVILLNGWILPIGGASAVVGLQSTATLSRFYDNMVI